MMASQVASAYDFEVDGIYYEINMTDKTVSVVKGDNIYTGYITIPSEVFYNGKTLPVVNIGIGAFEGVVGDDYITGKKYCRSISSIKIPTSITSISPFAFDDCYMLESVYIDDLNSWLKIDFGYSVLYSNPLYWVYGNTRDRGPIYSLGGLNKKTLLYEKGSLVTSIKVGKEITNINPSAFYGYGALESINLAESNIEKIGNYAFYGCPIKDVIFNNSLKEIGSRAFDHTDIKDVCLPQGIGSIGSFAFPLVDFLEIPSSVKSIPEGIKCNTLKIADLHCDADLKMLETKYSYPDHGLDKAAIYMPLGDTKLNVSNLDLGRTICYNKERDSYPCNFSAEQLVKIRLNCRGRMISIEKEFNNVILDRRSTIDYNSLNNLEELEIGEYCIQGGGYIPSTKLRKIRVNQTTPPSDFSFSKEAYLYATVYVPNGCIETYQNDEVWGNFWSIEEDNALSVSTVNNNKKTTGSSYDLQGRSCKGQPHAGIYFLNGKKILVK